MLNENPQQFYQPLRNRLIPSHDSIPGIPEESSDQIQGSTLESNQQIEQQSPVKSIHKSSTEESSLFSSEELSPFLKPRHRFSPLNFMKKIKKKIKLEELRSNDPDFNLSQIDIINKNREKNEISNVKNESELSKKTSSKSRILKTNF